MSNIPEIIKKYRKTNHLTQQAFGKSLIEKLPGATLTRAAVNNWERGKNPPRLWFMQTVQATYADWRSEMAAEVLAILVADRSAVSKGADGVLNHL